jgi:hypothetical protein
LRGKEYRERLNSLTDLQGHAVLAGNQVLQEIRDGVGNNVTADNDLRDRIAAPISRNTETHGTVTETFAVASEVHHELRETRQEISSMVNASCGLFVL